MLFEVAVVELPLKKDVEENGALEKLVFGPTFVVAKDQASAGLKALRSVDAKDIDIDRSQVLIRPFA